MQNRVKAPAIALLVVAALSILGSLLGLIMPRDLEEMRQGFSESGMDPAQIDQIVGYVETSSNPVLQVLGLAIGAFIAFGAWNMLKLQSWGLAVAASIVAVIPCMTCCCIGIPFGVWALIVLFNAEVKAAFAGQAPPPLA